MTNKELWSKPQLEQLKSCLNNQAESIMFLGSIMAGRSFYIHEAIRLLLCEQDNACMQCVNCNLFNKNNHPDVLFLGDIDGESLIKIDEVRYMVSFLQKKPAYSKQKIAVVYNAEKLNIASSNALLKTLEEPHGQSKVLLGVCSKKNVLPTINSRVRTILVPTINQNDNEKYATISAHQPLLAQKYATCNEYKILLDTLLAWPLVDLESWQNNLQEINPITIVDLMQVLLHDALSYFNSDKVPCNLSNTWHTRLKAIKNTNNLYLAFSYCNEIKSRLNQHVALNKTALIQQLYIILNGVWLKE